MRRLTSALSAVLIVIGLISLASPAGAASPAASPAVASDVAGSYHSVGITRVLNTVAGIGAHRLAGGATASFRVAGVGAVPALNVAAVTINLTVLNPTQAGAVAVFPGGTAWNGMESVSFQAGQTEQSMQTATLGPDGTLSVRNNLKVAVDLIGDVSGYYVGGTATAPGSYAPLPTATRVLNTQAQPIAAGATRTFGALAGQSDADVSAVVVNLTVIAPSKAGAVELYPGDGIWDGSPSVVTVAGRTQQRTDVVALGPDGTLSLKNKLAGNLVAVVDVIGYFHFGTATDPGARESFAPVQHDSRVEGVLAPGQSRYLYAEDWYTHPSAAYFDVIVVSPSARGSISVQSGPLAYTGVSTISFAAGASLVRPVTTELGVDNAISIRNNSAVPLNIVTEQTGDYLSARAPVAGTTDQLHDPAHGQTISVSCPTTTFCAALQTGGYVTTFDGHTWGSSAKLSDLWAYNGATRADDISCVSATFCAVGGRNEIAMFDGVSWTKHPFTTTVEFSSVSCTSTTFCTAIDERGRVSQWDGSDWSTPTAVLSGSSPALVSCTSMTWCIALVGQASAVWDGQGWTKVAIPGSLKPSALSCASDSFCVAVAQSGLSIEWQGTHWISLTGGSGGDVSCPSTNLCVGIVGRDNITLGNGLGAVKTLTGGSTSWSAPIDVTGQAWNAISCSTTTDCMVVSGFTTMSAYHWDGDDWSAPVAVDPGHGGPSGVDCVSTTWCLVVDRNDASFRFDGSSWGEPIAMPAGLKAAAVSCASSTFCQAVGSSGEMSSFDGSTWSAAVTVDPTAKFRSVSCASTTYCLAVDTADDVTTWNGQAWSALGPVAGVGQLGAVDCPTTSYCMAVTPSGGASHWDGHAWSTVTPTGLAKGPYFVSCPDPTYCLAEGGNVAADPQRSRPVFTRSSWNGSTWSPIPTDVSESMAPITCAAAGKCLTFNGRVYAIELGRLTQLSDQPVFSGDGGAQFACVGLDFCAAIDDEADGAILSMDW